MVTMVQRILGISVWDIMDAVLLKLKGSPEGEGMIQNLFLLSRNSAVEFFSDTEAVVGSNPTVTT